VNGVLADLLPLALVVTVSPLNIIPAILLLFTVRPLTTASCFLVGFVIGVGAVLGALILLAGVLHLGHRADTATWVGLLKLALGIYLLMAAVRKFRGRPRAGEEGTMPAWMDGVAGYTPAKALGAGVVLGAVNPKNLVVGLAAAATIASAVLSPARQVAAAGVYVVVAVLGVAAPIVAMLVLGARAPAVLDRWKIWLGRHNAVIMSALFTVFGVVLVGQGIAAV
jgi:threonine/homoserine/homoserine lactone efflux protein